MRLLLPLLLLPVVACGSDPLAPIYNSCFSVDNCVEAATRCEELSVEFSGLVYENAICTTECLVEGPLSSDCSRAYIGRRGSCYPSDVAGGIDDTHICFEPCNTDVDCLLGFRCLGALELCGGTPEACPVDPLDAICVPGPP